MDLPLPSSAPAARPPDRGTVLTERRADHPPRLDAMETGGILRAMSDADHAVAPAVRERLDQIGAFVDLAAARLARGGRLVYLGAGTSGRLGVLDASECPPTFQTDPAMVVGLIAGGDAALRRSSEHREDDPGGAHAELDALGINADDAVLGIAAGGTTPFVLGGVAHAKSAGAATGLLTCTPIERPAWCDVLIAVETGPEVIAGSTRLKAGTATKMVLNMVSTAAMVRLGKVYGDLMVDLRATNDKLRDRAARIVSSVCGVGREEAFVLLDRAGGRARTAVVMGTLGVDAAEADRLLARAGGSLRAVIGDRP